jgi:hypothetical protein
MGRRRTPVALALAVIALVAAGCMTPPDPGGGPVPSCPTRALRTLEQTDQVDFSLVRGLSANGRWVVTSRTVGGELDLTLRDVDSGAATPVGTVGVETSDDRVPVAVSDDGERVAVQVPPDVDGPRRLMRWERTSATLAEVAPPADGMLYRGLGPDATLAGWTDSLSDPTWVITDTLTDAVVGTDWTGLAPIEGSSRSGRFQGGTDLSDGSSVSLQAAFDSLGPEWEDRRVESVSPDGTKVLVMAERYPPGDVVVQLWVWDTVTETLDVVDDGYLAGGVVSDDGRVVLARTTDPLTGATRIEEHVPSGSVSVLYAGGDVQPIVAPDANPYPPQGLFLATADLRSVVVTSFTAPLPPTAKVLVARCV